MRHLNILWVCLLASCSEGGGEEKKAEEPVVANLEAGQWETSFEVASIRSTDKTSPALKVAAGAKETDTGCIAAGSQASPPGDLFAGPGYTCQTQNAYNRNGRINMQLKCAKSGIGGDHMLSVQGTHKGTSFEGTVDTITYLPGSGDFEMSRKMSGRKTAASCAAGAETPGKKAA